jgi:hypothetical protein
MVIYGIEVPFGIYNIMDPVEGFSVETYSGLKNDGEWQWTHTILPKRSPFPDHCYNCRFDTDKDEEVMDCGGPCPPCMYAPDKVVINTPTTNLPSDVRAVAEITAGNAAVKVLSGQNVTFTTAGEVVLLPGFEVESGANFDTQIKNSSYDVSAVCGQYCNSQYYPTVLYKYIDYFRVHDLVNVVRIEFIIYTHVTQQFITSGIVNVTKDGTVNLWDLTGSGNSDIWLRADIALLTCYGVWKYNWDVPILVLNSYKSLNEEFEESEFHCPSSSTNFENPVPQNPKVEPILILYPNPTSGVFQIETNFPLSEISNLKIINMIGATVYETQHLTLNTIQLPNSASGQHVVVLILKNGTVLTEKLMIQR